MVVLVLLCYSPNIQAKGIKMKKYMAMALAGFVLVGCSRAGPFVTNISADGAGGLVIERCAVEFNGWTGTVSNTDCTSSQIRVNN